MTTAPAGGVTRWPADHHDHGAAPAHVPEAFFGLLDTSVLKQGATTTYTKPARGTGELLLHAETSGVAGLDDATTVDVWHRPLP